MKVYMYRLIGDEPAVADEVGLAVVNNKNELFWLLDSFGDPYSYEYCKAQVGDAISVPVEFTGDDPEFGIGDKYAVAEQTDMRCKGDYISDNATDQARNWSKFNRPLM